MPDYRVRILHISDLHERVAVDGTPEDRKQLIRVRAASRHRVLGKSFLDALRHVRDGGAIDIVCFTGDIADWGLAQEYQKAVLRLQTILGTVGVAKERCFPVPGNHDVYRKKSEDAWKELRKLAKENTRGLGEWMAGLAEPYGASREWRDQVLERTQAFWNSVIPDFHPTLVPPSKKSREKLGYRLAFNLPSLPFPVHVIGLDSAWLAGDEDDAGKLLLTETQVDLLTRDDKADLLSGFRLALVHHPLVCLSDGAQCRRLLADSVDLLLHGHQHDPIVEQSEDPDRTLVAIAAGSLYRGGQWRQVDQ